MLEAGRPAPRITLPALFVTFLTVSMYGFGGPIVWARRIIVDQRGWLSDGDFAEILSFCQFLPGPNVVSISVCLGAKFRGPAGALSALVGLYPDTVDGRLRARRGIFDLRADGPVAGDPARELPRRRAV